MLRQKINRDASPPALLEDKNGIPAKKKGSAEVGAWEFCKNKCYGLAKKAWGFCMSACMVPFKRIGR